MELLVERSPRKDPAVRVHRVGVVSNVVAMLVFGAAGGAGAFLAGRAALELPWYAWFLAGPVALLFGGLLLLVWSALVGAVAASLRPTAWVARTGPRGLELNLRSYLNARTGDELPVLRLEPSAVRSMRRLTEAWTETSGDERRRRWRRWIELDLGAADTSELARVLEVERARTPPETSFLGVRSTTKHHHEPVAVHEPGKVRVEWRRRLFADLARSIVVEAPTATDRDLSVGAEPGDALERARDLARRGSTIAAITLLRSERGLGLGEARRVVEELRAEPEAAEIAAASTLAGGRWLPDQGSNLGHSG